MADEEKPKSDWSTGLKLNGMRAPWQAVLAQQVLDKGLAFVVALILLGGVGWVVKSWVAPMVERSVNALVSATEATAAASAETAKAVKGLRKQEKKQTKAIESLAETSLRAEERQMVEHNAIIEHLRESER